MQRGGGAWPGMARHGAATARLTDPSEYVLMGRA